MCKGVFDVGNDFSANHVSCYTSFGFALFFDMKEIQGSSGFMERNMVIVSPLCRSKLLAEIIPVYVSLPWFPLHHHHQNYHQNSHLCQEA